MFTQFPFVLIQFLWHFQFIQIYFHLVLSFTFPYFRSFKFFLLLFLESFLYCSFPIYKDCTYRSSNDSKLKTGYLNNQVAWFHWFYYEIHSQFMPFDHWLRVILSYASVLCYWKSGIGIQFVLDLSHFFKQFFRGSMSLSAAVTVVKMFNVQTLSIVSS